MILLETDRLILRTIQETDAPVLHALDQDPQVMRFLGPNLFPTLEAQRLRIVEQFLPYYQRKPGFGFWGLARKSDRCLLGWVVLRPALDYRYAREARFTRQDHEIGWRLHQHAWGQGFATEAARALMAYGLQQLGVQRVVACAREDNRASIHVMEKIGLHLVRMFSLPICQQLSVCYANPLEECGDL